MQIGYKKEKRNGIKGRIITKIKMLDKKVLPKEYTTGYPRSYKRGNENRVYVRNSSGDLFKYYVGDFLTEKRFRKLIKIIKQSGRRLRVINLKANEWEGSGTIKI